jgi:EAL and modified HD-GYP domain-containing signal transduction protein
MFQSDFENLYQNPDWNTASNTALVLNLIASKLDTFTAGRPAFIRFDDNMLSQDIHNVFPDKDVVIEFRLPPDIKPEFLSACSRIRSSGFKIMLDLTESPGPADGLLDIADIIKMDVEQNTKALQKKCRTSGTNVEFLAVHVDTKDKLTLALKNGYQYIKGEFYSRPEMKGTREVPYQKTNLLLLLQEINHPDISFDRLSGIIKRDVGLSYKLMKYINSAYFGFAHDITSLKYALVLLGILSIRKWLSKETLHSLGKDKPDELVSSSLVRARFGELLCQKTNLMRRSSEMFLIGLFSRLDAFLDRDLGVVLENLPVSDEIKCTLTAEPSAFTDLYQLMLYYEKGDWYNVKKLSDVMAIQTSELPLLYIKALEWSHHLFCEF